MSPALTPQAAQRNLRVIHSAFLVAAVAAVVVGEALRPSEAEAVALFKIGFAAVAILEVAFLFLFLRPRWLTAARQELAGDPSSPPGLQDWLTANLISFVICESILLFGLVLRVLGGSLADVTPFYLAGAMLLVILAPRGGPPGFQKLD